MSANFVSASVNLNSSKIMVGYLLDHCCDGHCAIEMLFHIKSCFNGDYIVACLTGRAKSNVVKLGVRATLIKCHTTDII